MVKKTNFNKNQMESTIFKRNTNYSRKIKISEIKGYWLVHNQTVSFRPSKNVNVCVHWL